MKILEKKINRVIIFFGIIIFIYIIYLNFNSSQINPIEKYKLIDFREEWNENLPDLKKKIENNEFTELAPNSKWERVMIPYGEELPELPSDKENNKDLFGIDSNSNGVRDDLEILTVKEFGDDRDVVEVLFIEIRRRDFGTYLYKNNLIVWDRVGDFINKKGKWSSCYFYMTNNFDKNHIYKKYYNTHERKKVEKKLIKSLGGHISWDAIITKGFCKQGVEESKTWMYRNK